MKRMLATLAFSGLVALGLGAAASSAQASAITAGSTAVNAVKVAEQAAQGNVVEVGDRDRRWSRDRRWKRHHRRHNRPRAGFYFEFGTGGYRAPYYAPPYYVRPPVYARPRYVAPRAAYRLPAAHVNWCHARYRSYRAYDNSFQPYNGPRRACVSPYIR